MLELMPYLFGTWRTNPTEIKLEIENCPKCDIENDDYCDEHKGIVEEIKNCPECGKEWAWYEGLCDEHWYPHNIKKVKDGKRAAEIIVNRNGDRGVKKRAWKTFLTESLKLPVQLLFTAFFLLWPILGVIISILEGDMWQLGIGIIVGTIWYIILFLLLGLQGDA